MRASSARVPCKLAAARLGLTADAPRRDGGASATSDMASPITVCRRTDARDFGQRTRALSAKKARTCGYSSHNASHWPTYAFNFYGKSFAEARAAGQLVQDLVGQV